MILALIACISTLPDPLQSDEPRCVWGVNLDQQFTTRTPGALVSQGPGGRVAIALINGRKLSGKLDRRLFLWSGRDKPTEVPSQQILEDGFFDLLVGSETVTLTRATSVVTWDGQSWAKQELESRARYGGALATGYSAGGSPVAVLATKDFPDDGDSATPGLIWHTAGTTRIRPLQTQPGWFLCCASVSPKRLFLLLRSPDKARLRLGTCRYGTVRGRVIVSPVRQLAGPTAGTHVAALKDDLIAVGREQKGRAFIDTYSVGEELTKVRTIDLGPVSSDRSLLYVGADAKGRGIAVLAPQRGRRLFLEFSDSGIGQRRTIKRSANSRYFSGAFADQRPVVAWTEFID